MPHDISLISTIAAGLGLALVFGYLAARLSMPPLLGYLLAGILIGPGTPGFVADVALAGQLAEIGVMLLMFGVGLHFSLGDLMAVRRIAVPGAIVQIAAATVMGMLAAYLWGWSIGSGLVFGISLSVASTVVLLKALEAHGALDSPNGRIAVGWLVVEDLVMVLVLVLLPAVSGLLGGRSMGEGSLGLTLFLTLVKVSAFIALMLVAGKRVLPRLLWLVSRTGSRELFTLCVAACAIGVAFGAAKLFDVSFALGAFFAGMMMRESELSHRAADETLPLRDAFAVLFFVSVGMLFDPRILLEEPLRVLVVVAIIMVGKTLAAAILVIAFRYPLSTALTVGASLAQIGEFSFILAGLGASMELLSDEGHNLILAGALISIALNSFLFRAVDPLRRWVLSHSEAARKLERREDPLAELPQTVDPARLRGQVVVVGYGDLGRLIVDALRERQVSCVVADRDRTLVEQLRANQQPAVAGDAADPVVLVQAHVARAALVVVTVSDSFLIRQITQIACELNPSVRVVALADNEEEAALLRREGVNRVFLACNTLADGMVGEVLAVMKPGQ